MGYAVVPVSDEKRLKEFLRLPFVLYCDDPHWVPPVVSEVRRTLDPKRNPYFANAILRLFLCYRDGTPTARLAIVIDRLYEDKFGIRTAFFGFFESANDDEAARRLFGEAAEVCRAEGARILEGPFNPNHYSELGLQVDKFGTFPSFFQPYNPAYYSGLLEKAGFRVSARFQTMKNDRIREYLNGRYGGRFEAAERPGYTVRPIFMKHLSRDLESIREINNEAFAANWHFLPLSREEVAFSAKHLRLVTRPNFILIAEHLRRPVGVLHCALDINPALKKLGGTPGPLKYLRFLRDRKRIKKVIIFTVAIKNAYQHSRVYYLLLSAFVRMARDIETLETTWISPDNAPSVKAAETLGMTPDKAFAIYAKDLNP
jgi:hypothetical protein